MRDLTPQYLRLVAQELEAMYGPPRDTDFLRKVARDPVDTLIKTVLSQATNDRNSEQAFAMLKALFPAWEQVASAPEERLAEAIKIGGLGPQKSRRIKAILEAIRERTGGYDLGVLESMGTGEAWDFLIGLDGVGPKTAACTLLFAFGRPVFPVDTHIHRILRRLGLFETRVTAEKVQEQMQPVVPSELAESLHVNLIRLGREVCSARAPLCARCPLSVLCDHSGMTGVQEVAHPMW